MNLNTRTSDSFFGRTKMNVCIALLKKRFLYFISMMLMIGITQFGYGQCVVAPNSTQLISVGEGTIFSIDSGSIFKADQLTIQPSSNFILTNNSLTRNQTITNPLTLNAIKRVYKFENTIGGFRGNIFFDYQICELNGNNPSKLTFGANNGSNWGFYVNSVNKFPEYSVSKTFSPAVSINEMTLGYCDPSTAAVLSGDTSICGYGIGVASLKVNITGGVGNYTIVLNDGSKDTTINNYYNGSDIRIKSNETKTYSLVSVRGSGGCYGTGNSGTATITVFGPLNSGSINTTGETICYGGNPATILSVTDASGGDGNYKYSWFASPGGLDPGVDGSKAYLDNITGLVYTKTFVRWVEDGCSVNAIPSQGSYTVTVLRKFTPGGLDLRDQLICAGQIPDPIMGRLPGAIGGDENITYKWQYKDGTAGGDANGWKDIPNSNVVNYIPTEGLTRSTTYRRLGKDGTCVTDFVDESTVVNGVVVPAVYVNVNIKAPINPGSISSSPQEICYNSVPTTINNLNLPSGADYYQYKWQANGVDINISQESYSQNSLRLTETTTFTRWVKDAGCPTNLGANDFIKSDGAVVVTVKPQFNQGEIGRIENGQVVHGETICLGGFPSVIGSIADASGGDGLKYYQWRRGGGIIPGQSGPTLDWRAVSADGLSTDTWFTRVAKDGTCINDFRYSEAPESYKVTVVATNPPTITVSNNCGYSTLTASNYTGNLLWETNVPQTETHDMTAQVFTTSQIGDYRLTQTVNGCASSLPATAFVVPKQIPVISNIIVQNFCRSSSLSLGAGSSYAATYLWSNNKWSNDKTTSSGINVDTAGNYRLVITNDDGCSSQPVTVYAEPIIPSKPTLSVENNCGSSTITVSNYSGNLRWTDIGGIWSSSSRVVNTKGTIGVYQEINNCISDFNYVNINFTEIPGTPTINPISSTIICPGSSIPLVTLNLGVGYSYVWRKDGVVITGQNSYILNATETGSYDVSVRMDSCEGLRSPTKILTVSANPIPAKPSITADGPTTFCSQDQSQVTLTATGLAGNTGVWTDIRMNSFGTRVYYAAFVEAQESAVFELRSKNEDGCISEPATIEVIKKQSPAMPTITGDPALVNGSITVCNGSTVKLTANGDPGNIYLWSNTETTKDIIVTTQSYYKVKAISPNGCTSLESYPAYVYLKQEATPSITASKSGSGSGFYFDNYNQTASICIGGTITLTSTAGSSYLWSNGATSRSINVSQSGSYSVQVTGALGCVSEWSVINVVTNSIPPAPTANVINNCAAASSIFATNYTGSLQWYDAYGPTSTPIYQGSYYVTQTVNGCVSPASNTVVTSYLSNPYALIINDSRTTVLTCNTASIVATAADMHATGETFYSWSGPNGFTANTATTQFTNPGIYTVIVTNAAGCSNTKSIYITEDKYTDIISIQGDSVLTCLNASPILTAYGGGSYSWNAGAGVLNSEYNTVTNAGQYTVTAINMHSGCPSTASITVMDNRETISTPTIQVDNRCDGTALLTAIATGSHTGGFEWKTNNQIVFSRDNSFSVAYVDNVTYLLNQTFGGCSSQAASVVVSTGTAPTAGIVWNTPGGLNCRYPSVSVTASGGTSYSWTGPNGFTSNTATTNFTKPGRYTVTVTAANGCTATNFTDVYEDTTKPTISIVNNMGSTVVDCLNPSIQVSATGSFTNGNQLTWSGGANTTGVQNSFTQHGTYTLTATDPINGCSSTASINITQGTQLAPVAGIINNTGSTQINCTNDKISVTATGGTTYSWSNGVSTAENEFTAPGTYVLTVANDYGCTDTKNIVVTKDIHEPLFGFTYQSNQISTCSNPEVRIIVSLFYVSDSLSTFTWSRGTPSSDGRSATFTTGGAYTITATGANGCTLTRYDYIFQNRSVYPVTFNNTLASQLVTSTTYKLSGGTSGYMVGTGDYSGPGVTKNSTINAGGGYDYNFDASVAGVGTHTITFTTTSPQTGCTNTATNTITVYPAVDVTFNGALASQCVSSNNYTLTGGSPAGGSYSGNGVSETNFDAAVAGVGTHTITYIYIDPVSGFTLTATKDINVYALNDLAPLTGAQEVCVGATTLFSASLPGGIWSSNNNDKATVEGGLVRGIVSGTATISYTLDNGVCPSSSVSREVTVLSTPDKPTITAGENRVVCSGETVSLVSSSVINNQWYLNGNAIISNATSQTYLASATGLYTVKVISNGCESAASDTVSITVKDAPIVADITGQTVVCAGAFTLFENDTTGGIWSSSNELVAIVNQLTGLVSGISGGTATIYYTKFANGCTTIVSKDIQVNPLPVFTLTPNAQAVCEGSSTLFFASITGGVWSSSDDSIATVTDNGVLANMQKAVVSGLKAGTANITYTIMSLGCSASVSKTFTVNSKLPLSVSIASDATNNTICAGSRVTFTATPTNGGGAGLYQWKKGADNIGGQIYSTYSSTSLQNNDDISVVLISNGACISASPATSNLIRMTVNQFNPSVTIQSDAVNNSICKGATTTFSATPVNGGAQPQYTWLVNGSSVSTSNIFSSASLIDGDQVKLTMVADQLSCRSGNVATSNIISVAVNSDKSTVSIASDKQYNALCAGSPITFTATPVNGGASPTYQWYVGNNSIIGQNSAVFTSTTLAQGDRVSVRMISNGDGCLNGKMATSNEIFVNVNTTYVPSVSLISSATNNTICAGASVQFTANPMYGGNAPTYKWFVNGVEAANTSTNVFTAYNLTNGSRVNVEMTSNEDQCLANSLAVSDTIEISTHALPAAPITTNISRCGESVVVLQATAPAGASVYWSYSVGGNSFQSSTVLVGETRTYYAESVNTTTGCISSTRTPLQVTINEIPVRPVITATSLIFCSRDSVILTSSADNGNQWYFEGNPIIGATNKTYAAKISGNYTVVVMTEFCNSLPSYSVNLYAVQSPAKPTINASGSTTFCEGENVTLSSSLSTNNSWYLNGQLISSASNIYVTQSGSYTLQRLLINGNLGVQCPSELSDPIAVVVNQVPATPTIQASGSTTICNGSSLDLTSSSATGNQWYFNGNPISVDGNNQHYFARVEGLYKVKKQQGGCSSQESNTIIVYVPTLPVPTITAGPQTSICNGGSVVLTSSLSSTDRWYLNGVSLNVSAQTYTATLPGTYTVKYFELAYGCESEASEGIVVTGGSIPATPTISVQGQNTFCEGGSVDLTSSSTTNNRWYKDGQPLNWTDQTYTATLDGTYTVKVNQDGCESLASAGTVVTVLAKPAMPTITASGETTICAGGSVGLSSSVETGNQWYLNGQSLNWTDQNYIATQEGTYTIRKTEGGCEGISNAITVVIQVPSIDPIQGVTSICIGSFTTLSTYSISSGSWTSSNTAVATVDAYGNVFGYTAGTTTIKYTVWTQLGCENFASILVTVGTPAIADISGQANICLGSAIAFTNSTNGGVWSSDNTNVATVAQNGMVTGISAGVVNIKYTITNGAGCSAMVTKSVTVNSKPETPVVLVEPNSSLTFCEGGNVILNTTSGGTLQWFIDGNALSTLSTITATEAGSYTVQSTLNGCVSDISVPQVATVTPRPGKPVITRSGATTICEGAGLMLTSSAATGYQWYRDGSAITINGNNQTYTPTLTGTYTVVSVSGNCSSLQSEGIDVTVITVPALYTYSWDDEWGEGIVRICEGMSTNLILYPQPTAQVQWYKNGVAIIVNGNGYSYTATESGLYTVRAINGGCYSALSNTVEVIVNTSPQITNGSIQICSNGCTVTASELFAALGGTPQAGGVWTPAPSGVGVYTYTVTTDWPCYYTSTATVTVSTTSLLTTLNLKVYLEGFYTGNGTMAATLYDLGNSTDATATDTIKVSLYASSSSANAAYSQKVILHKNGTASVQFPGATLGNSYYIAINHRNSIETWSAAPVAISATTSYDFSTGLGKAYGDGFNDPMKAMGSGVYALYSGDVNQDGSVAIQDLIQTENDASILSFGYNSTDCNGDGSSDLRDLNIIENNAALNLFTARP